MIMVFLDHTRPNGKRRKPLANYHVTEGKMQDKNKTSERIAELEKALREILPLAAAHLLSAEEREKITRARALIGGSHEHEAS